MAETWHETIIVTLPGYALRGVTGPPAVPPIDLDGFRAQLPEAWRQLVVGPVLAAVNDIYTIVFLPDGSKEGREEARAGGEYRSRFLGLFSFRDEDGGCPYWVVQVRFDDDTVEAGFAND